MPSDFCQLNFRYALVVKACALEEDFSDFVEGDQTEVIYMYLTFSVLVFCFDPGVGKRGVPLPTPKLPPTMPLSKI